MSGGSNSSNRTSSSPMDSAAKQDTASLSQEEGSSLTTTNHTKSMFSSSFNNNFLTSSNATTTNDNTSANKVCCSMSRTVVLRTLLTVSLLLAMAVITAVSYGVLREAELEVGRQTYESLAQSALAEAHDIALRKIQGSQVMATLLAHTFPRVEDWPLISVKGYQPIAQRVADLTSSGTQALMILLDFSRDSTPSIEEFERHTLQEYQKQNRPPEAGRSEFGFGIWKPDPNTDNCQYSDCQLHDTTTTYPTTNWNSQRTISTPIMMHNQQAPSSLLYNAYSQENRGIHIDSMLDCVDQHNLQNNQSTSPNCAVITDILELKVRPGPAGILLQPIFPAQNPTTVVGFATTSIHWEEVLTSTFPDFVSGLTCVVSTETTSVTYEIDQGVPRFMGPGDLHHDEYSHHAHTITLNDPQGASTSAIYTLTVYPTAGYFSSFRTNSPRIVSCGMFAVVTFCTLVFVLYDYLMRSEAHERKVVLEMKRRFVRFISHEIRTPLNTVCMGLELLLNEFNGSLQESSKPPDDITNNNNKEDVEFWCSVCNDIQANAQTAVEILNDLLNYDKLEMGTLALEAGNVHILELVQRTVQQFQIQAVNRKVDLKWKEQTPLPNNNNNTTIIADIEAGAATPKPELLTVLGDDVKLGQVLRNLISNSLKFTPAEGTIDVTTTYIPDGMPDAKPLLLSEKGEEPEVWSSDYPRAGSIQIRVKDTGIGLTKAQLAKLFQEGVQFDANRLQHGGGSGLGLSIAKGMVEQHSGTIRAESDGHGTGTSFIIELPLYNVPPEDVSANTSDAGSQEQAMDDKENRVSSSTKTKEIKKRRILIAEDAVSSLKMMIRLLERAGHKCVGTENGKEACEALQADMIEASTVPDHKPFDIVLLDYEMPLMTGPEAAAAMRKTGYEGPIVGVTGNILSEDTEFFKTHGATEVLPKPVTIARINAFWEQHEEKCHRRRRRSKGGL